MENIKEKLSFIKEIRDLVNQKGTKLEEKDIELIIAKNNKEFEEFKSDIERKEKERILERKKRISKEKQKKLIDKINQIRELMLVYDIKLKEEHLEKLVSSLTKDLLDTTNSLILRGWETNLKLAELIIFLYSSIIESTSVTFSTTIKGLRKSVVINQPFLLTHFYNLANTLLDEQGGEKYSNLFGWRRQLYNVKSIEDDYFEFKQFCVDNELKFPEGYIQKHYISDYFCTSYGDYQIEEIIKLEKEAIIRAKKYRKHHKSIILIEIVNYFRQEGVFKEGYKTIQSDEACFLYDVMGIFEIIKPNGFEVKTEKYDYIKRRI